MSSQGMNYCSGDQYQRIVKAAKDRAEKWDRDRIIEGEYTVTDIKDLWNEAGHSGTKEEG